MIEKISSDQPIQPTLIERTLRTADGNFTLSSIGLHSSESSMEPESAEKLLQKVDTGLNADTVEWCPYESLENILLCGTYKLQEKESSHQEDDCDSSKPTAQTRIGGVTAYVLKGKGDGQPYLSSPTCLDLPGVLDIKWPATKIGDNLVFGLVDADGCCKLVSCKETSLTVVQETKLTDDSLGLSLGFSSGDESGSHYISASDSAGYLTVLDVNSGLKPILTWHAHEYEAWITAFHKFDTNLIFSGGDDCRLKVWDIRDNSRPTFISKRHQMGVCSVQSHPFEENVFATGSYDEELVVWDRRSMKMCLASAYLGGGIWRIKWNPSTGSHILTATMYNGTHIVDYKNSDSGKMPVVVHHEGHNLAYGADWCRLDMSEILRQQPCTENASTTPEADPGSTLAKSYLIATCSFYDHSLHLWEWENLKWNVQEIK